MSTRGRRQAKVTVALLNLNTIRGKRDAPGEKLTTSARLAERPFLYLILGYDSQRRGQKRFGNAAVTYEREEVSWGAGDTWCGALEEPLGYPALDQ